MAPQQICKINPDCLRINMKMKYEMKIEILKINFVSNLGLIDLPYIAGNFHKPWLEISIAKIFKPHAIFIHKRVI